MRSLKGISGFLLLSALISFYALNAQQVNIGPTSFHKSYTYYNVTLLTGADFLFPANTGGVISVSFPFTVTNAAGTTSTAIFNSQTRQILKPAKFFVLPLGFNIGGKHAFFNAGISFQPLHSAYSASTKASAGYGYAWYFNGTSGLGRDITSKRFSLKASLNIVYNVDGGYSESLLGTIDNESKRINALGFTADSSYTIGGWRYHPAETYAAKTLNVSYSQRELSLLPKITLSGNPFHKGNIISVNNDPSVRYRGKWSWDLSLGYNFAVYDRGGIILAQDNGSNDKTKNLGRSVSIQNPALTFSYNNKITSTTPYHFTGWYISFAITAGRSKIK